MDFDLFEQFYLDRGEYRPPFTGIGFSNRNQGFTPPPTEADACENSKAAPETGCAWHDVSSLPVWKRFIGPGRDASSHINVVVGKPDPRKRRVEIMCEW